MSEVPNSRKCDRFKVSSPSPGEVEVTDKVTKHTRKFSGAVGQVITDFLQCNACVDAHLEDGQSGAPGTNHEVLCNRTDGDCRLIEGSGV